MTQLNWYKYCMETRLHKTYFLQLRKNHFFLIIAVACDSIASATSDKHSVLLKRKELIKILWRDPDNVFDELFAQFVITREEYSSMNQTEDTVSKIRKLLIQTNNVKRIHLSAISGVFSTLVSSYGIWIYNLQDMVSRISFSLYSSQENSTTAVTLSSGHISNYRCNVLDNNAQRL